MQKRSLFGLVELSSQRNLSYFKQFYSNHIVPKMNLSTPSKILDFWFGSDRSIFNEPSHIKHLMGVWFNRTNPDIETTFAAEADQIEKLAVSSSLSDEWHTPQGFISQHTQNSQLYPLITTI